MAIPWSNQSQCLLQWESARSPWSRSELAKASTRGLSIVVDVFVSAEH
ncbi:hypothetical protein RBSWK_05603 [Rhodopirellula baltica SWK14]|uniref:Uncharacterized protein n=1 Tax=Rhodopirellula baltica SWK14 TaxID=993516 RepID=L7C8K7_RHOBT|nr:hypothetical protein RBSWK_05603 [Rhodopirellula baltica SWK14]